MKKILFTTLALLISTSMQTAYAESSLVVSLAPLENQKQEDQYLSYNFGTTEPGRPLFASLTLSNDGAQDLTVEKISLSGIDFSGTSDCPKILKANESCNIRLRFWPNIEGYKLGRLSIYTSTNDIFVDLSGWCRKF